MNVAEVNGGNEKEHGGSIRALFLPSTRSGLETRSERLLNWVACVRATGAAGLEANHAGLVGAKLALTRHTESHRGRHDGVGNRRGVAVAGVHVGVAAFGAGAENFVE